MGDRGIRIVCYAVSAAALIGAVAYLLFAANKTLGFLLLIIAAILSRVLIVNIVMRRP